MCDSLQPLSINTPFLESFPLSMECGKRVFLKMESFQPSGSFKLRGLGNLILKNVNNGVTHLVSASGGNAGMATAYAGRKLGIPVTVVIPESTPKMMIPKLEAEGAKVLVHGNIWSVANQKALEMGQQKGSLYVHPFEHELIWDGHATIVDEILESCPEIPSAFVCSVGGGGLLCGLLQGIQKRGLKIPVVAMETFGANCFNLALKAGKPVTLPNITSIAKTLGASSVTRHVFDLLPHAEVLSYVVEDATVIDACIKFADDHRTLVEPSCGAALAAGYTGIIKKLFEEKKITDSGPIVFIVCGGTGVSLDLLKMWKQQCPL